MARFEKGKSGNPGAAFAKGKSGNPGGRPKAAVEVRDLARVHTAAAINRLVAVMEKGKSEQARIMAANSLLDRGWGKPNQPFTGDTNVTATVKIDARATLLDTLTRIAAAAGEGSSSSEDEPGGSGRDPQ